jgi:hypothetical protein
MEAISHQLSAISHQPSAFGFGKVLKLTLTADS